MKIGVVHQFWAWLFLVVGCMPRLSPTPTSVDFLGDSLTTEPHRTSTPPVSPPSTSAKAITLLPPLPTLAPDFWATVGVPPDTLIPIHDRKAGDIGDIAVMRVDGTMWQSLTDTGNNLHPILSPDHQKLAFLTMPQFPERKLLNVWAMRIDGSQTWQLTSQLMWRSQPAWSPDNEHIIFSEGPDRLLVEVAVPTGTRRDLMLQGETARYQPTGNGIGYITLAGGLDWQDAAGMLHTIISSATLPISTTVHDFDWLPDGDHVVFTLADETERFYPTPWGIKYSVWIAQLDGAEPLKLADAIHSVEVAPNGQVIAARAGNGAGDTCWVGEQTVFLQLASDLTSAQVITLENWEGFPHAYHGESFYPTADTIWLSERLAYSTFELTCFQFPGGGGVYLLNPLERYMTHIARIPSPLGFDRK